MKKGKSEVTKIKKEHFNFKSTGDDKKDIEILKRKLQRKANQVKEKSISIDYWFERGQELRSLLDLANKKITYLEKLRKMNLETIDLTLKSVEKSSKLLCNMVLNEKSNLFPQENYDITRELKQAIKLFSSLAHSKKNDLLKSENIQDYLQQRN